MADPVFVGIRIPDVLKITDDVAEHCVYEIAHFLTAQSFDKLDSLVHRSRLRHLVQKEDLVQRNAQRILDIRFCLGKIPVKEPCQHPVQFHLPTDDAGHNFVHQPLVELVHVIGTEFGIQ